MNNFNFRYQVKYNTVQIKICEKNLVRHSHDFLLPYITEKIKILLSAPHSKFNFIFYALSTSTSNKCLAGEYLGLCPATPFSWTFDSRAEAVVGRR